MAVNPRRAPARIGPASARPSGAVVALPAAPAGADRRELAGARRRPDPLAVGAIGVLALFALLALAADLLSAHLFGVGPTTQRLQNAYAPPDLATPALWLGADELGRSQVVRLLYAARISLGVGFAAAALNLLLGVSLGLAAGYFRGWVDDLLLWLVSTLKAVPSLFLLLAVATVFDSGPGVLILVLGLLSWPSTALFVRGQVFAVREREFITAARALGVADLRIALRHVLPNVLPFVATLAAIEIGSVILAESALSFLGLGIIPPTPSWGNMLMNAAGQLGRAPWLVWGPGLMILLTVLALYLLGDSVRDALDPTSA